MKLGLYGWDSQVAAVVRAAASAGDAFVLASQVPAAAALPAGVPREESWEPLVDEQLCDAVVVGTDDWSESRADGLRRLVQAGRRLLLSHPLTLSMLLAYELDMIRVDTGAVLLPVLPDRQHPFIGRLRELVEGGLAGVAPIGRLESIAMTRRLPTRSREEVLAWLARDADLLRLLIGEPQRLSTLAGVATDAAYATLTVEFGGSNQLPARWQVASGQRVTMELAVRGDAGEILVEAPSWLEQPSTWTWRSATGQEQAAGFDGAQVMLERLRRVVETQASTAAAAPPAVPPEASWSDAARAIELAETVPRSLARGRAIDLHQEEFSELGTFKGTMASLGCGLVMAALVVLIVATLVGGIAHEAGWEFGERLMSVWPLVVLVVLGAFLALQVLPWLVQPRPAGRSEPLERGESRED